VVHQHFNIDATQAAKLLVAEPNWVDVWGVDIGSGFEMLEPAPEYRSYPPNHPGWGQQAVLTTGKFQLDLVTQLIKFFSQPMASLENGQRV